MPARVYYIDRIIRRIYIPIQFHRVIEIDRIRILRQEPPHDGIIVPRPQIIQARQRIELLSGVEIAIRSGTRLVEQFAKGDIGIGIRDSSCCICQRAGAALSILQVVTGPPTSALRDDPSVI